jgi:uncharacterized OB-fold protein
MAEKSLPKVNGIDRRFWQGTAEGKLLLQKCRKCDQRQFFPRPVCTRCFSTDLDWIPASGRGRVHSFTWVRVPRNAAFKDEVPICYADIILEEGVLMQSRVLEKEMARVRIETEVSVTFQDTDNPEIKLPVFEVAN